MRTVVAATQELRADDHLALMLASEPGTMLGQLTVEGVPRIIRFATAFLAPLAEPYLDRHRARRVIDVLARLTISYFLAPSDDVDLGDEASARAFLRPPAQPVHRPHLKENPVSVTHRDNDEILGRAELDDIEAILSSPTPTSTRSSTPSRTTPTPCSRGTTRWPARSCASCTRRARPASGTPRPTCRGTPRSTSRRSSSADQIAIVGRARPEPLRRHGPREVGRQGVARLRHPEPPLDAVAVPPRRAGRPAVHGQDHRDRAVVRRQAVRLDAGRRRGPPRRGLRPLPRGEARRRLPGQRPPADAARRHHQRQPAGT